MSSTGPNPFDPDYPGGTSRQADPAEAFAAAMRDLWGFGAAMLHATAAGAAPAHQDQEDVYRAMAAPAADMLDAYAMAMARLAGGNRDRQQAADLSPALAEAGSVAIGSAFRYGQGLAELFARHQGNLLKAATGHLSGEAPSEQSRAEAEELRAFLRDVGETALLEARRLEHELTQLGEAVAQGAAPSAPDDPYKRRWAAKP